MATLLALALAPGPLPASAAVPQADERSRIVHLLNRATFGPRPKDIAQVQSLGIERWIEMQIHPEPSADRALTARLAPYRTLAMSSREMVENYPPPPVLKAVMEGRLPMPSDPKKRAVYESQIAAYKLREERKAAKDPAGQMDASSEAPATGEMAGPARREQRAALRPRVLALLDLPPGQRIEAIQGMSAEQRVALGRGLGPEQRERMVAGMNAEQRQQLLAVARPQQVIGSELQSAKLIRAIYSENQLAEVMTDFWFNHFNIFLNKGADRYLLTEYEREAIRKHAFGKFKDLLLATASSAAMMFYLDNFQSVGPNSMAGIFGGRDRPRPGGGNVPAAPRGLNENYARELLELHTLGVDGGYTQKDVQEVAKVFSGWTIRQPRLGGAFEFNERLHEPGDKLVLGKKIHAGGMGEGKQVLEMLARQPATARFVAKKLAMRFVSDDPPAALVDRLATTYTRSDGDIREVLRALFRSPEFWVETNYRAKVKTPLEFVVSAIRATGADVQDPLPLVQTLERMGMPLYGMQPPTGYAMKAEAWVNSAALLDRMNFALAIGTGKLSGISAALDPALLPADADGLLNELSQRLIATDLGTATRTTIQKQLAATPAAARPGVTAGLILGSPEFQRR